MNELTVKGSQEFLGISIPIVEGGFGEDKRCILAKDIATVHEVELKHVNEKIKANIDEFEKGVDIIDLKSVENIDPLRKLGFTDETIRKSNNIYLLSESGYMTLCMFMRTKIAKEKRQQFKREYFAMREAINNDTSIKDKLLLKLFSNDPVEVASAHKQLIALETKPLLETIQEQSPYVEMAKKRIDATGIVSVTELNDIFECKRGRITRWLKDNGYLHKTSTQVNEKGKGLFRVYLSKGYNCIGATEDGVQFINKHIDEIK